MELGNGSLVSPQLEKYFDWLCSLCSDKKKRIKKNRERERFIKFKMSDEKKKEMLIINQLIYSHLLSLVSVRMLSM